MDMFRRLIAGLKDIIYPKICLSCRNKIVNPAAEEDHVCLECLNGIKRNLPPFCHSCGRHLKGRYGKSICPECVRNRLHFDRAFSPCVYEGVIKDLICEFKYKGKDYLGKPLSSLMVKFIREYDLPIDYIDGIIPIPLYKTKLREREFNQAQVLAQFIAKEFSKDILTDVLHRRRNTRTQTELETAERMQNVKGSFAVARPDKTREKNLLLIDDVLTSGATSSEAAQALKESGANIVFVLTLAN